MNISEHLSLFNHKVIIFGRNAMHFGVEIRIKKGTFCFRLPLFCYGKWWELYAYYLPNGCSTYLDKKSKIFFGKNHKRDKEEFNNVCLMKE